MSDNIWYISKYVTPPYAARVGTRGFFLIREFARAGHNAVLITSDSNHLAEPPKFYGPIFHEVVDAVDVHWLKTSKYDKAFSFGRILSWLDFEWKLLRMNKSLLPPPDVVIVSSLSILTIFNGLLLRRKYNCKLVFEVRDIWPMVLVITGKFGRHNPFVKALEWIEKFGYRRADVIVGTMPNLAEHVHNVTGKNFPVFCIPHGIDVTSADAPLSNTDDFCSKFIPNGKFVICHAGSIGADNALETLINCARLMINKTNIHFLIIGEGYLKNKLEHEAKDLPNVTFAPGVPKSDIQSVLSKVNVVYFAVHRSPMLQFGQSLNKVIDYMWSGKPVLASYTGFRSMINEADCGSFVEAEDAVALRAEIERYTQMPQTELDDIGRRGKIWLMKNRDFKVLAAKYLSILGIKHTEV